MAKESSERATDVTDQGRTIMRPTPRPEGTVGLLIYRIASHNSLQAVIKSRNSHPLRQLNDENSANIVNQNLLQLAGLDHWLLTISDTDYSL